MVELQAGFEFFFSALWLVIFFWLGWERWTERIECRQFATTLMLVTAGILLLAAVVRSFLAVWYT